MTRITDNQAIHSDTLDPFVLTRQAQAEVGHDIAAAVNSGFEMIDDICSKLWQAISELTTPPTAAA